MARETSAVLFDHLGLPDHRSSLLASKASPKDKTSEVLLFPEMLSLREVFVCVMRKIKRWQVAGV